MWTTERPDASGVDPTTGCQWRPLAFVRPILLTAGLAAFAGCDAPDEQVGRDFGNFFSGGGGGGGAIDGGAGWRGALPPGKSAHTQMGSGRFLSSRAPAVSRATTPLGENGFELNLENAPIAAAADFVLGEALGLNYSVDPDAGGTMTLQTSQPVSQDALLDVFQSALAANGLAITETSGVYRIVEAGQAVAGTPPVSLGEVMPAGPGVRILVVPLSYISADEMREILIPISPSGAVISANARRNYLLLSGNRTELAAMLDAISVFDIDSMRGKSLSLHPLETSSASAVASQLDEIFDAEGNGDLIRFVPNEQLNSVLVISTQPNYIPRAAEWIAKLDGVASSNDSKYFMYPVQNRSAAELAEVLQAVLTGNAQIGGGADLGAVEVSTGDNDGGLAGFADDLGIDDPSSVVVADAENNALLLNVTPRQYRQLEPILVRLDRVPTQVLLEALIVEVGLNDDLRFGVRWFLENGSARVSLSDLATGATGAAFPGFAWNLQDSNFEVTLNALSSVTNVEVISSPTLMALNNQEAVLQIGDQVPIVTQTATTGDLDSAIVNSVELRDTGIILNVIPRVNSSGGVLLDIEQEASRVVETTTSGIDSPTIQQRRIRTRVSLSNGEALILGGLIQDSATRNRSGVPVLSAIPGVGNAFRNKNNRYSRTELLIFVRPRVLHNAHEARAVSSEFRRRLNGSGGGRAN